MRRILLISGLLLTLLLTALAVSVNVVSSSVTSLPAPDRSLPVRLADGTDLPLGDVLDRLQLGEPLPRHAPENLLPQLPQRGWRRPRTPASIESAFSAFGPAFVLAEQQLHAGNLDQALALYASVREGEPGWPLAQRRIGWHILAKGKNQPGLAVSYVNKALLAKPFSHNSWHDLTRVYSRTLGFDLD